MSFSDLFNAIATTAVAVVAVVINSQPVQQILKTIVQVAQNIVKALQSGPTTPSPEAPPRPASQGNKPQGQVNSGKPAPEPKPKSYVPDIRTFLPPAFIIDDHDSLVAAAKDLQKEAEPEWQRLAGWLQRYPELFLGLLTAGLTAKAAFDYVLADNKKLGDQDLKTLVNIYLPKPQTQQVTTVNVPGQVTLSQGNGLSGTVSGVVSGGSLVDDSPVPFDTIHIDSNGNITGEIPSATQLAYYMLWKYGVVLPPNLDKMTPDQVAKYYGSVPLSFKGGPYDLQNQENAELLLALLSTAGTSDFSEQNPILQKLKKDSRDIILSRAMELASQPNGATYAAIAAYIASNPNMSFQEIQQWMLTLPMTRKEQLYQVMRQQADFTSNNINSAGMMVLSGMIFAPGEGGGSDLEDLGANPSEPLSPQGPDANAPNGIPIHNLTPEELGIKGTVKELKATMRVDGKIATIRVDMVNATIDNPIEVVTNAANLAWSQGADVLYIEGTIVNEKLLSAGRRWGLVSEGANETIIIKRP